MKRLAATSILLVLALLFTLAGCGGQSQPQQPQLKQADFDQSFSGFTEDVGAVANEVGQDLALLALAKMPNGAPGPASSNALTLMQLSQPNLASSADVSSLIRRITPLSGGTLPYGRLVYNETSHRWERDSSYSGDDLVLVWSFEDVSNESHGAQLTTDWNYQGHETVDATAKDGSTVELPTDTYVSLEVDGSEVGHVHGQFAWYSGTSCGTIAEPTSVSINGRFGASDHVDFSDISLQVSDSRVVFSGSISASAGGDSGSFSWSLTANGSAVRGDDCFMEKFNTNDGNLNLQSSVTKSGQTESSEFNTNFTVNYDSTNTPSSLDLSNGYFKLNGQTAFTFSGTLDDSNHNGIPGENVTVTFADGSTTLEELIMSSHN